MVFAGCIVNALLALIIACGYARAETLTFFPRPPPPPPRPPPTLPENSHNILSTVHAQTTSKLKTIIPNPTAGTSNHEDESSLLPPITSILSPILPNPPTPIASQTSTASQTLTVSRTPTTSQKVFTSKSLPSTPLTLSNSSAFFPLASTYFPTSEPLSNPSALSSSSTFTSASPHVVASTAPAPSSTHQNMGAIIGGAIGGFITWILALLLLAFFLKRNRKSQNFLDSSEVPESEKQPQHTSFIGRIVKVVRGPTKQTVSTPFSLPTTRPTRYSGPETSNLKQGTTVQSFSQGMEGAEEIQTRFSTIPNPLPREKTNKPLDETIAENRNHTTSHSDVVYPTSGESSGPTPGNPQSLQQIVNDLIDTRLEEVMRVQDSHRNNYGWNPSPVGEGDAYRTRPTAPASDVTVPPYEE